MVIPFPKRNTLHRGARLLIACAARTERASLWQVGIFSNLLLLWGIAFELVFAAALIYLPPFQMLVGTRPLELADLGLLAIFPVIVWGVDEGWRATQRWQSQSG